MPLPSAYTEASLAAYMEAVLGETGVTLGLPDSDALPEAVNEVIGLLGHDLSEETSTTGLMKVRASARWQAWKAALDVASGRFDVTVAGGKKFVQSQVFEQIQAKLKIAESDYYAALAADDEANGTGLSFFAFGTVCGRRGR